MKQKNAPIVVGTLGRVADLIRKKELDISQLQFLIVDEADQLFMSDDKEPMADILAARPECQTMIFSATFSPEAKTETAKILREGFREVAVDDN